MWKEGGGGWVLLNLSLSLSLSLPLVFSYFSSNPTQLSQMHFFCHPRPPPHILGGGKGKGAWVRLVAFRARDNPVHYFLFAVTAVPSHSRMSDSQSRGGGFGRRERKESSVAFGVRAAALGGGGGGAKCC